jgi:hypothetical protein
MVKERQPFQDAEEPDAEQPRVWPEQVIGGKYIRLLSKHLDQLRNKTEHGNRKLFLDDVFVVYLLAYFNPTVRSLRTVEDFSQTPQVQKHLSAHAIYKSTLSDFNKLVDPTRLEPILTRLRSQCDLKALNLPSTDQRLTELLKQTVAVDGTFLPAMADVAWAVCNKNNHDAKSHKARVDVHLNVSTWIPEVIVVPEPGQSESESAIAHLQPNRLSIYDRGYMSFDLIKAHHSQGDGSEPSPFVVRYKSAGGNSPELTDARNCELGDKDRAAGVVSDRIGRFTSVNARKAGIAQLPLREVVVAYEEKGEQKIVRLITNMMDVPAHVIALLYRYRWQVELFFRWLKSYANFTHLISHNRQGLLAHFYVTIIAVMLMYLHGGFRPNKYLFALLAQVAMGAATLDEILPILRERERQIERDRQAAARRRAKKKQANG